MHEKATTRQNPDGNKKREERTMSVAAAQTEPTENNQELQRLLRDSAASFARRGGVTRARHLRKTKPGIDPDIWSQLAGQGWLGILIPESFGGQGLGFAEMAVVAEELARTLGPEPLVGSSVFAASLITASSNERLKAELLPALASGKRIAGTGFASRFNDLDPSQTRRSAPRTSSSPPATEPNSRSIVSPPTPKA